MPEERDQSHAEGDAGTADEALRPLDAPVREALAASQQNFFRFLVRQLGSREDAEDALQEVWLKVVRGKAALDREGSVEVWLRRVLRNVVVDQYRQRAARRRFEDALRREREAVPSDPDPELEAVVCICLHRLLSMLKPEYAELLRRVDLSGEPREWVACQLGLTLNNLAVRLHRARQALRKRLEQTCETCPTDGFRNCACLREAPPRTARRGVRPAPEPRLNDDGRPETSAAGTGPRQARPHGGTP